MDFENALWCQLGMRGDGDHPEPGTIVRIARQTQGLTLAQLGERCGYSASQISRYERGLQPLTDLVVLRLFANTLAIPPQLFGLLPGGDSPERHAASRTVTAEAPARKVSRTLRREDGEDRVRRRELLAGIAG